MEYHKVVRWVCSRRRHHIAVIVTNVGATVASKRPKKNRAVIRVEKLRAEVMQLSVIPCMLKIERNVGMKKKAVNGPRQEY